VTPEIVSAIINSFGHVAPEMILGLAACVAFLGGTFRADRNLWAAFSLLALAGAGLAMWLVRPAAANSEAAARAAWFAGPVVADSFAQLIRVVALVGGAVLILSSWKEIPDRQAAEYQGCLLIILAGVGLTGAANDLVTLFLALELISIPTYVLLYLPRHDNPAQEAAMKYFLLSVFSSALVLLGFSYLYGLAGTTNLPALADALGASGAGRMSGVAIAALVLVIAGLGFRITAVPFHFYAPDVYQGTATAGAALLAFIPKVAGFAALLRLLNLVPQVAYFHDAAAGRDTATPLEIGGVFLGLQVSTLLWIIAAATMTLGNVLALLQDNLKRLLAYSSIAHAGYMLVALAAAPYLRIKQEALFGGVESLLFYLGAYGAMTIGAFAVLSYLDSPERPVTNVDDLAGLAKSHPGVAFLMLVFLFSFIGIPLTAGFAGKFFIFLGAVSVYINAQDTAQFINAGEPQGWVQQGHLFLVLAVVGMLNSAIGAWYYLRIAAVMYLRTPLKPLETKRNWPGLAALAACALVTLGLGIYGLPFVRFTQEAVPQSTAAQPIENVAQK
jgi:NADH-quinone oxidoreductase subunit N